MRRVVAVLRLLRAAYSQNAESLAAEHPVEAKVYALVARDLTFIINRIEERL